MAGKHTQNGKCPEGFMIVFDTLCIETDTLSKAEEAMPDLPDFEFKDTLCETTMAAYKSVLKSLNQAIETPRQLMQLANSIIERPFAAAKNFVDKTLSIFDNIDQAIDQLISGVTGPLDDLKAALEQALNCPFFADTEMGKLAAQILDVLDGGNISSELLKRFKQELKKTAYERIDAVKDIPLNSIQNLEKLYNDALQRFHVEEILRKAMDLYKCLEAACNMVDIAKKLGNRFKDTDFSIDSIFKSIGGVYDEATGKIKFVFVKTGEGMWEAAEDFFNKICIIRLAGGKG